MRGCFRMKTMFISKELNQTAGSGVGARMHLASLKRCVGEQNVFVVDVSVMRRPEVKKNYIAFGKYRSRMDRIIRNLQGNIYFFSKKTIRVICSAIKKNQIEFVFVDDSYFGKLVQTIKKKCPDVVIVTFFHDVKAELFPIWMKRGNLASKIEYRLGIYNEKISVRYTDANIVLNKEEDMLLQKHYGKKADAYFPVCVECGNNETHINPYDDNGRKHLLFVGTDYYPNTQGIKWFYANVLSKTNMKYDLWLVGRGLDSLKNDFTDDRVHAVGCVERLEPYYKYADAVIAPLTDGGGMKIKTAEALSQGKVFLGSSESLHGYYGEIPVDLQGKIIFKCDTAQEYLSALRVIDEEKSFLRDERLVQIYQQKFSPESARKIMEQLLTTKVRKNQLEK